MGERRRRSGPVQRPFHRYPGVSQRHLRLLRHHRRFRRTRVPIPAGRPVLRHGQRRVQQYGVVFGDRLLQRRNRDAGSHGRGDHLLVHHKLEQVFEHRQRFRSIGGLGDHLAGEQRDLRSHHLGFGNHADLRGNPACAIHLHQCLCQQQRTSGESRSMVRGRPARWCIPELPQFQLTAVHHSPEPCGSLVANLDRDGGAGIVRQWRDALQLPRRKLLLQFNGGRRDSERLGRPDHGDHAGFDQFRGIL